MNTEILSTLTKQSKQSLAPVLQLNQLAIANAEKLAALQLASFERYAKLGLIEWKMAVLALEDPQYLQTYLVKQGKLLKIVCEKFLADTQQIAQLSTEFSAEAQQVVQEGVAAVLPKAA